MVGKLKIVGKVGSIELFSDLLGKNGAALVKRKLGKAVCVHCIGEKCCGIAEINALVSAHFRDHINAVSCRFHRQTVLFRKACNSISFSVKSCGGIKLKRLHFGNDIHSRFFRCLFQTGFTDIAERTRIIRPIYDFHKNTPFMAGNNRTCSILTL